MVVAFLHLASAVEPSESEVSCARVTLASQRDETYL